VYDWNSALCKANEDLDKLHVDFVRNLHEKYEATCQMCLTEIEKYKVIAYALLHTLCIAYG